MAVVLQCTQDVCEGAFKRGCSSGGLWGGLEVGQGWQDGLAVLQCTHEFETSVWGGALKGTKKGYAVLGRGVGVEKQCPVRHVAGAATPPLDAVFFNAREVR